MVDSALLQAIANPTVVDVGAEYRKGAQDKLARQLYKTQIAGQQQAQDTATTKAGLQAGVASAVGTPEFETKLQQLATVDPAGAASIQKLTTGISENQLKSAFNSIAMSPMIQDPSVRKQVLQSAAADVQGNPMTANIIGSLADMSPQQSQKAVNEILSVGERLGLIGTEGYEREKLDLRERELAQRQKEFGHKATYGTTPQGFTLSEGQLTPTPGGKPAAEFAEKQKMSAERQAQMERSISNVTSTIDEAMEFISGKSVGIPGQILKNFGGTDAALLQTKLDTIQANVGFDKLQQMRDSSPTGGALGQVSNRELHALQSVIASLNATKMTPAELRYSLGKVQNFYNAWAEDQKLIEQGGQEEAQPGDDIDQGTAIEKQRYTLDDGTEINEGQIIVNPQTNERMKMVGGQWQKI